MAKGQGIRFIAGATCLSILLLIAAGLMVSSWVIEGLDQKVPGVAPASSAPAPPAAAPSEPKPAEEGEQEPSKHCAGEACVYVASNPGATPPHPGPGFTTTKCGLSMVAHKSDQPFDCNIATMSHAIAAVCAKGSQGKTWCNIREQDAWIPLPHNINDTSLAATAAPSQPEQQALAAT